MCPKQNLNIGTGKLNMKDHMEKWRGLGGKSLRIFVVVVVVSFYVCFLALTFFTFYRNSCREVFQKKSCSEDF